MPVTDPALSLRGALGRGETLVVPDAFDGLSARLIERAGFAAVQCSGYSMALALGLGAEEQLRLLLNIAQTRHIVQAVDLPVQADAEDGYGDDPIRVTETVRAFVAAGVAGLNLEDQTGQGLTDQAVMIEKIHTARAVAESMGSGLVINARTDVLRWSPGDLDQAIRRANCYLEAGADLAFVARVTSLEEVDALRAGIAGPLSIAAGLPYNLSAFSVEDLVARRVAQVSLPTLLLSGAVEGMKLALAAVPKKTPTWLAERTRQLDEIFTRRGSDPSSEPEKS